MIQGQLKVSPRDFIFSRLSEYDIYRHYIGPFEENEPVCNVLRGERNPSMVIRNHDGVLYHFDNGDDRYRGECIHLVMQKYYCSYAEALQWIMKDFGLSTVEPERRSPVVTWKQPEGVIRRPPRIHVVTRPFNQEELKWCSERLIGLEDLKREHFYAGREFYRNYKKTPIGDGIVLFHYYPDVDRWKIYRPQAPKNRDKDTPPWKWKWDGNLDFRYVENLEAVRGAKRALLEAKTKDRMYLMNLLQTDKISNVQAEDPACLTDETMEVWSTVEEKWGNGDDDPKGHQFTEFLRKKGFTTVLGDFVDIGLEKGHDYVREHFRNQGFI